MKTSSTGSACNQNHFEESRHLGPESNNSRSSAKAADHRLDAETRAVGLAGIAEARAVLAECATLDLGATSGRPEDEPAATQAVDQVSSSLIQELPWAA